MEEAAMMKMTGEEGVGRAPPVEISAVCKRKLVHWVNSLPLASCLLVEELAELRFGDVLWAIVRWLETGDDDASNGQEMLNQRDCVEKVAQYAAQRCSAKDRDVMYIVHGAQCVARVLEGDEEAIAALLLVLKRLAEEREARKRAQEVADDEAHRRELSLEIARRITRPQQPRRREAGRKNSLPASASQSQRGEAVSPIQRETALERDQGRLAPRSIVMALPECKINRRVGASRSRGDRRRENGDERNAPPPTPTPALPKARGNTQHTQNSATAKRHAVVVEWLRSLGVKLPDVASPSTSVEPDRTPMRVNLLLKDGVALCVLAAAIVRRRGSVSVRHKLHTVRSSPGSAYERGVLFARGATLEPKTQAEMRHNLAVAWSLLQECRMLDITALTAIPDENSLAKVLYNGDACDESVLLQFLEAVMNKFELTAMRSPAPAMNTTPTFQPSVPKSTVGKRPYITSEQIDVVKKWMKESCVDPNAVSEVTRHEEPPVELTVNIYAKVSSGILEDSLRNGVALCQLINKSRTRSNRKIVFKNPPKTLIEVRSNIHSALSSLALDPKFPLVYATSHAMEGIVMGDKQYIFGILWVFMQFCKDEEVQRHQQQSQSVPIVRSPRPSPPPEVQPEVLKPSPPPPQPLSHELRPAPRQLPGFELDVLASELVEEDSRMPSTPMVWATTRAVPWDELDSHDDIVPFAVLRDSRSYEPSVDIDILPQKRAAPRVPHGISPDPVPGNDSVSQTKQAEADISIPKTNDNEIREASAVDDTEPTSPAHTVTSPKQRASAPSLTISQVKQVIHWLKSLGINLRRPQDLHTPDAVLTEFQSGVLLCEIVETLEHMRPMEGICRQDNLAKAQALHNIEKALVVLQSKKAGDTL